MKIQKYHREITSKFDFLEKDRNFIIQEGLPIYSSTVMDCFIPLSKFKEFHNEEKKYINFASASDLFFDRAFFTYEIKTQSIFYFYKDRADKKIKKEVNSSFLIFLECMDLYHKFKSDLREIVRNSIYKKSVIIELLEELIHNMHELDPIYFSSCYQYWPEILMEIPMNYSHLFQDIDEVFKYTIDLQE